MRGTAVGVGVGSVTSASLVAFLRGNGCWAGDRRGRPGLWRPRRPPCSLPAKLPSNGPASPSPQLLAEESLPATPFYFILGKHRQQQAEPADGASESELVQLPVTENIPAISEVRGQGGREGGAVCRGHDSGLSALPGRALGTDHAQRGGERREGKGVVCLQVGGRNGHSGLVFSGKTGDRGVRLVWWKPWSLFPQLLHTPAHVLPSAAFLCSLFINSLLLATEARR